MMPPDALIDQRPVATSCPPAARHLASCDWALVGFLAVADLLIMSGLVAAASAALGVPLAQPTDLGGSADVGPRMLAVSPHARLVIMSDLGSGPSLADVLLTGPSDAAAAALLGWARACGELALATSGRQAELTSLRAAYRIGSAGCATGHWLRRRIEEVPGFLAELSVPLPVGLAADLADVGSILRPGLYEVFSPGDICPDNNLLTAGAVKFVDYESAEFHSAFLDAAYVRMPFSTCWCVFRLPESIARSAETQ